MSKIESLTAEEIEMTRKQYSGFSEPRQHINIIERLLATLDARDALLIDLQSKLTHEIDKAYNLAIAVGEHYENEKRLKAALAELFERGKHAYYQMAAEEYDANRVHYNEQHFYDFFMAMRQAEMALTKTGQAGEAGGNDGK